MLANGGVEGIWFAYATRGVSIDDMFTGIIRHVGPLRAAGESPGGRRLVVDVGPLVDGLGHGDSVCVNGVCLTVTELTGSEAAFDVMAETLGATTLGGLRPPVKLNLERSLAIGDRLDGHIVQGHVDGIGKVIDLRRGDRWELAVGVDADLRAIIVPKGSVAIDGVSLTVVDVDDKAFRVALIPTTLDETTLGDLRPGNSVNIETDVIGKYVQRYLQQLGGGDSGGLTLDKLRSAGFC